MGYAQPQGGHRPPPRKGLSRGCLIALIVIGVTLLLISVGAGVLIYVAAQNEDVRRAARIMGEGVQMVAEAQYGPGVDAVREAGCDQAMVMNSERLSNIAEEIQDGGFEHDENSPSRLILCQVFRSEGAPSCEGVVRAYLIEAPRPAGPVAVTVVNNTNGQGRPLCSKLFNADGGYMSDFEQSTGAQMPQGQNFPPPPQPQGGVPTPSQRRSLP